MWQDPYGIRWAEENGVLYIQGGGKREPFLLPPFAGKDAKFLDGLLRAKEWFVENKLPFRFKGVSKAVKERMEDLALVAMSSHLTAITTNTFTSLKILSICLVRNSVKRKTI